MLPSYASGQKKARCGERAESISLEENRGDSAMMPQAALQSQLSFVMSGITFVNELFPNSSVSSKHDLARFPSGQAEWICL
jgi:hypothetical protein